MLLREASNKELKTKSQYHAYIRGYAKLHATRDETRNEIDNRV